MEIKRLICTTMVQVRNGDNKIVFVGKNIDGKISINFPNTNLKKKEDFKDGAKRQIFEMTGLNVREEDIEFAGIIEAYEESCKKITVLYKAKVRSNIPEDVYSNPEEIFWESLPNIRNNRYKLSKYFNLALKLYTTKFSKCVYTVKAEKEEIIFFI